MAQLLMPKATAVWLVQSTTLTFEQIAEFCGLHSLEVQGIADGEVAIGIVGLAMWRRLDTARAYGWLLAAGYGLAFLYGLFAAGNSDINFLSINGADNGLHLVSALAGLAIAFWPAGRSVRSGIADHGV